MVDDSEVRFRCLGLAAKLVDSLGPGVFVADSVVACAERFERYVREGKSPHTAQAESGVRTRVYRNMPGLIDVREVL